MDARHHVGAGVFQPLEERPPFGVDRRGIGFVAGIQALDIVGIAAVEERRAGEGSISVLTRHAQVLWLGGLLAARKASGDRSGREPTLSMRQLRRSNRQWVNCRSHLLSAKRCEVRSVL